MKKLFFAVSAVLLLASCKKPVYGCTDKAATNFNSEATDQGAATCEYSGTVTFWQASDQGILGIGIEGNSGAVTKYYPSGVTACGLDGNATFTLPVGTHHYEATNANGTAKWSGEVTITSNDCLKFQLR